MITTMLTAVLLASGVRSAELEVRLDPPSHAAEIVARFDVTEAGSHAFRLHEGVAVQAARFDGAEVTVDRTGTTVRIETPGAGSLELRARAVLEQDVQAGERAGQIHNHSVHAHIGDEGVFLSDGSAWHPQPIDAAGHPALVETTVSIAPLDGWAFVASGEPRGDASTPLDQPRWTWHTPRATEGIAIVGNRHVLVGKRFETSEGSVDVVMHVSDRYKDLAEMFVEAAGRYLDIYVPRLGAFPYKRFSIVENFFSSGFAFPGFTLLGPQVVGMAPRSLAPGYLDHELVHNWWGNGVYVSRDDGNWCEALTSFCTNYGRRVIEDGERAAYEYRRGVLMKLSADPEGLDNGPLGEFGYGGEIDRFVGYDKGAFVFIMLERMLPGSRAQQVELNWAALRRFADEHMGGYADWDDLRAAYEAVSGTSLDAFFETWVRKHTVPRTRIKSAGNPTGVLVDQIAPGQVVKSRPARGSDGTSGFEIDMPFAIYRVLPPYQVIPTIAGTLGPGGLSGISWEDRPEATNFMARFDLRRPEGPPPPPPGDGTLVARVNFDVLVGEGENILLVGTRAIRDFQALWQDRDDPIVLRQNSFTVGGREYGKKTQAVLHTMRHPSQPGRYITVFHSNGEEGWSRLRVAPFYTRDTTIIWQDGQVLERRVHEPSRVIVPNSTMEIPDP